MIIANIKYNDVSNGPGLRTSIYTQGCPHRCKGCFNPQTWNPDGGRELTTDDMDKIFNGISEGRDLSFLGGEPLAPYNIEDVEWIAYVAKSAKPDLNIWCWTGYVWEDLMNRIDNDPGDPLIGLLVKLDVLVDGKFEEDLKDLTLAWRGSSNQRIIDVQKSLKENKIVLLDI